MKFSQPDVLVSYDPELETSYINAYTVGVRVKNLITGAEVEQMPKGHQAIVKDTYIQVIKLTDALREIDDWGEEDIEKKTEADEESDEEVEHVRMNNLLRTRSGAMALISASPSSDFPVTSQNPPPGKRPVSLENRVETVGFTLIIDE